MDGTDAVREERYRKADHLPEIRPQESIEVQRSDRAVGADTRVRSWLSSISQSAGRLRATELSYSNIHMHGELFYEFLTARREVFIDGKGWDLPQVDGMEFDQYDTGFSKWIAIHEYGQVIAGVRVCPTTAQVGLHSYMLRDAQLGLLEGLRRDLLFFEAPVSPLVWEATRLFIKPDVPSKQRLPIQFKLISEMAKVGRRNGATHIIGIVPAVFLRWLTRIGMSAVPAGPECVIAGDRVCAALFRTAEITN